MEASAKDVFSFIGELYVENRMLGERLGKLGERLTALEAQHALPIEDVIREMGGELVDIEPTEGGPSWAK